MAQHPHPEGSEEGEFYETAQRAVLHFVLSGLRLSIALTESALAALRAAQQALDGLGPSIARPERAAEDRPAVPVAASVQPDYLVCLEDGLRLKILKRHLRTVHGLAPEDYRRRWDLPPDYPMVAPNYAVRRADLAKESGLGRSRARRRGSRRKPRGKRRSR